MAVIKRLRTRPSYLTPNEPDLLEVPTGSRAPAFLGETISGATFTNESLIGSEAIFAFFDTGCSTCKTAIPELIEYAQKHNVKSDQIVSIISGDPSDATEYITKLSGIATIILDGPGGSVSGSFGISGIPAYVVVDGNGIVVRSGKSQGILPQKGLM
ncbi:TlpA disulfide reductase family protein [Streptomyces sp. NPDC059166]|uniref:TlpA disulfide reductase family protein n=1 Tax=Streptomyces sp. NPDC059166 TaxID=3346752 RepID=UPI0036A5E531